MAADGEGFFERAGRPAAGALAEAAPDRRRAHAAAFGLKLRHAWKSASETLSAGQRRSLAQLVSVSGVGGIWAPEILAVLFGAAGFSVFAAILAFPDRGLSRWLEGAR